MPAIDLKTQTVLQNAYVVDDLNVAIERWNKALGLGPFFTVEDAELECLYRGNPSSLRLNVAMAQAGPINIELIEQLNDAPSVYRDMYPPDNEGFHHVCMLVDNFEEQKQHYRSLGCDVAFEGDMGAYSFCYVDARPFIGYMIELVEDGDTIRAIYDRVREGAESFDGSDLIRSLHVQTGG